VDSEANIGNRFNSLENDLEVVVETAVAIIGVLGALLAQVDSIVEVGDIGSFRARVDALERDIETMHTRVLHRWPKLGYPV
jgi:hypothetical protein